MRVLGLIPARGGSKGVPRKNMRTLGGKPLLQYTVEAAASSAGLNRLVLSTEDAEIAALGRQLGVDVPFTRPAELAADDTPMYPVVRHALMSLEKLGEYYDAVCLLQPTNPMRTSTEIDGCIELLARSGADSVVTVLPVPHEYNPHWVYFRQGNGTLRLSTGCETPIARRQDLPAAFHREGSVYVTRRDVIMNCQSLYGSRLLGYEVDDARSVNIDTESDWSRAEALVGKVAR